MASNKTRESWVIVSMALVVGGAAGCGSSPGAVGTAGTGSAAATGDGGAGSTSGAGGAAGTSGSVEAGCPDLFVDGPPQDYSFDISASDWQALDAEFHNLAALESGQDFATYHPVVFHHGNQTVSDAAVKLHGQSSWMLTVMFDSNPKMQFDVSFKQKDPNGQYHGVTKLVFDMPRSDWTFLHERLSDTWLRQVGIMAPCTTSARLSINGTYYGLYVMEEDVGGHLVSQFFPQNPGGDLWKGGYQAETNQQSPNYTRLMQWQNAKDLTSLSAILDIPGSINAWAAEAILNDSDGYYGGFHNFFLYDEGTPGFVFIPHDLDSTFDWLNVFDLVGATDHPVYWWYARAQPASPPGDDWLPVLGDPGWRVKYAGAIESLLGKWNVAQVQGWIDAWSKDVAPSAAADPHRWATPDQIAAATATARDEVAARAAYLQTFVDCEHGVPAAATDGDGDGYKWCDECDDKNPNAHPGAPEVCGNMLDDNCNGVVDEGCPTAGNPDGGM
jgi:hypothetical protein